MKKVTIISLFPVSATGGGESYTIDCAISASLEGFECELVSPCNTHFCNDSSNSRLSYPFNSSLFVNGKLLYTKQESFRQILSELANSKYVWIHQYLGSKSVFDILLATHSAQTVLFTNLGFEPNAIDFWIRYSSFPNHIFVEISKYSANRTKKHTKNVIYDYAGVWQKQIDTASQNISTNKFNFVSVNRVLIHKAIEVTIDALPKQNTLIVVGPNNLDLKYEKFLKVKSKGKKVEWIGEVSTDVRNGLINNSIALIASSATQTYRSLKLEQSELLGLVLLESILNNTIPISSSQPALAEVMSLLELEDFIYPERDSLSLRSKMELVASLSERDYSDIVSRSKFALENKFLWDNFWRRIEKMIQSTDR